MPDRPVIGEAATLLDRFLPEYQFGERHEIWIDAEPERVIDLAAGLSLGDDSVVRVLMGLREGPVRALGMLRSGSSEGRSGFSMADFTPLGRIPGQEIAWGLVGRFWRPGAGLERVSDPDAFLAYAVPGRAKLVWSFRAEPWGSGTRLVTRTGVHCPDVASRRRFAAYWLLIRPWSGLIRRRLLAGLKARAEAD